MVELLKQLIADWRQQHASDPVGLLLRWMAGVGLFLFALFMYAPALGSSRFVFGTDTVSHDYPMHFYAWVRSISGAGELPLWNPYVFSGLPMIGSAAICPFYPTQWLYGLLPFNTAFTLQYIFALAVGGIGAAWWMRCLSHRRAVCVWAGLLYMVSGHFLTLTYAGHLQKMIALGWTPVALGATIQIVKLGRRGVKHSRRYKAAAVLGIALGMQLLATHPQVFYATAAACVFQLVGLALFAFPWGSLLSGQKIEDGTTTSRALRNVGRAIAMSLLALIVCAALAAVQLFPSLEMSALSNRAGGVSFAEATQTSYPPMELLEYAVPSIFGDSVKGSPVPYFGKWGERIVSDYIGIPVLVLALLGLFGSRRRYRWFLLFLFVSGILIGLGRYTPLYWVLWGILPGFDGFRSPGTFMFLSNCALVGLAALGLDYLLNLADNVNASAAAATAAADDEPAPEDSLTATGAALLAARSSHPTADETQPLSVSEIFQDPYLETSADSHDPYRADETPPQGIPSLDAPDFEHLSSDPGYSYSYPDTPLSQASSNFTWDSETRPWLARPGILIFIAALALVALVAAIIALAENWDVNLKIATEAERISHHTHARVAGAAVAVMVLMGGLLLLRLRTWIGGVVIGAAAIVFPLAHNLQYLQFDPLPPYMAHLTRQPDLTALAKREARPVRLLEENALKTEDMLYGISSVAGYHPITIGAYTQTAQALGFGSQEFGSLFAMNFLRATGEVPPAAGEWNLLTDLPDGNGKQHLWQRASMVPYLRENATVAVYDTSDISLTSTSINAIYEAAQFGRGAQYVARISADDAARYRLVEGVQQVTAQLQKWLPHEVRLRVNAQAARPGARVLLPVSDPWFPGWTAETSRATPLPVLAVNGVQRGVALPPGEQNIRFKYTPYSFRLGLFVSLFSLTLLLFYTAGTLTRRVTRAQKRLRKTLRRTQTGQHALNAAAPEVRQP